MPNYPVSESIFRVETSPESRIDSGDSTDQPLLEGKSIPTILVAEDEKCLRQVIVDFLQTIGYDTIEAADGAQALSKITANQSRVKLLLTDLVMPKMNGVELSRNVRKLDSNIPIIYMSGYYDEMIAEHTNFKLGINFLQKPFERATLVKMIERSLPLKPHARLGLSRER